MITAKIDQRKFEKSLKQYAKKFGETSAQAVIRWSIQTCRDLAKETQAVPKNGGGPRKAQVDAITSDAYNVLLVVDKLEKSRNGFNAINQGKKYYVSANKVLMDASQVNWWIEINRTRRRARTAKLPSSEKKVCDAKTFKSAIRERSKAAGMAKGAWIGAGNDIAKAQKGQGKMNIGVGFLKYSQKHAHFGSSIAPKLSWNPKSKLTNKVRHSADPYVVSAAAFPKASAWGLKKTVEWYRRTLRAIDKQKS